MDFELHYTGEQESFRTEVQDWLKANLPDDMEPLVDPTHPTSEQYKFAREFRSKLGEKGWRAPTWPTEYGGGGLSIDMATVIDEELAKYPIPQVYDIGVSLCAPALMVWATEEQKQKYLRPILRSEVTTFQLYSEPDAGSDLASIKTRAIRDGDEYVLNGQKIWNGSKYPVDLLYTLAVTDPDAPRHNNMSAFMIDADTPGITKIPLNMFAHYKNEFYLDNVRVPASCRIGPENEGWRVANSTLEVEHGGGGSLVGRDRYLRKLIDYCKTTMRNGKPLSKDERVQQILADLYIKAEVGRLWGARNYWMRWTRQHSTYEGGQNALQGKLFGVELAKAILDILGPYATVTDPTWAPLIGEFEHQQRYSLAFPGGGTPEIQKLVMARRLGTGKQPQSAAATY